MGAMRVNERIGVVRTLCRGKYEHSLLGVAPASLESDCLRSKQNSMLLDKSNAFDSNCSRVYALIMDQSR